MSKLVYIVSSGHSGSTLLDMVIGSMPGVFSTGEVKYLPWQLRLREKYEASVENLNVCSCLKPFNECEIWTKIIETLNKRVGFNIYDNPYRFNLSIGSSQVHGQKAGLGITIPYFIFRRSIDLPFFNIVSKFFELWWQQMIKNNWLLFDAIGEVCGVEYIVDSTKDYRRFKFLHSHRPNDTYLIILQRDIFGFVNSCIRLGQTPQKSLKGQKKLLDRTMKIVHHLKGLKYLQVGYEELCKNPVKLRKKIAHFLRLSDPGNELNINTHNYHIVAGNPMRYKGHTKIRLDESWKRELDDKTQNKIKALAKKYGIY